MWLRGVHNGIQLVFESVVPLCFLVEAAFFAGSGPA
jgi:hypothetical protein